MDFLKAIENKSSSCSDISSKDEPTGGTEYHTLTDDEDSITATSYDSLSVDLNMDLSNDSPASTSDYQTLSPDLGIDILSIENQSTEPGKPDNQCKICVRQYSSLQECLRHELLEHSNGQKSPQKSVRRSLSHLLPVFENTNQQADRARIHALFQNCKPGMELQKLFDIYCIRDEKVKQIVTEVSSSLLKVLWPFQNVRLCTFGSCENGLMMWDSDIDMYVTMIYSFGGFENHSNDGTERRIYNRINSHLRRSNLFDEVFSIRRTRVPIIKCRHLVTGMRIDINCSCPNSVVNTAFLRDLMHFDVRIHSFMRFMKVWAKQMWIVGRNRMTSYCLCMLALFYLQQPRNFALPLIPSIQKLQRNVPPKFVQGVNYAFDLHWNMKSIPAELTTSSLVRGFFKFYRNFNFFKEMIVPYLGISIPLEDFRSGKYRFPAYHNQLNAIKAAINCIDDNDIEKLNIDKVMVIQDPFQLNQNVSRGVPITQLEYFRKSIEYGYHISMDAGARTDGQFYEALLFDIIGNMENEARQLRTCYGRNTALTLPHEMLYKFTPSSAEIRALTAQQLKASLSNGTKMGNTDAIYQLWTRHYIEAIYVILTHVYCLDVQIVSDNEDPFNERLVKCNTKQQPIESTYSRTQIVESLQQLSDQNQVQWIINSSIDTWTGRSFQRDGTQSFMAFQCAQTKEFLEQRKGKPAFAVKFIGRFLLKPFDESKILELSVKQHQHTQQWFFKKEPMRKFFTNFKCSLQNFNFKEKLQAESGFTYGMPGKSGEDFLYWQGVTWEMNGMKSD